MFTMLVLVLTAVALAMAKDNAVVHNNASCSSTQTCCLEGNMYGCCDMPMAECCSGFKCCQRGWKCNGGRCVSPASPFGERDALSALQIKKTHKLKAGAKCGKKVATKPVKHVPKAAKSALRKKSFAKVPLQQSDAARSLKKHPAFNLQPSKKTVKNVVCPGGTSICSTGQTCCLLSSGGYGCCPFPNATCCADHVHCCPNGYTCETASSTCVKSQDTTTHRVAMMKNQPAMSLKEKVGGTVACPDGKKCPFSAFNLQPSKKTVKNVVCPGGTSVCSTGQTCCLLSSGGYGCCPFPNATCCADHLHCCPNGYTCETASSTCVKSQDATTYRVAMKKKQPAMSPKKKKVDDTVTCPDGGQCPSSHTCCKLASGGYGCCPYPNATCCSDHLHCCPNGYKCEVASSSCVRSHGAMNLHVAMMMTKPAMSLKKKIVGTVTCPDGGQCPSSHTCCKLASGGYGCCPYPNATCCSDHIHCCPSGFTCEVTAGTCAQQKVNGAVRRVPLAKKKPAAKKAAAKKTAQPEVDRRVCHNGAFCPGKETCCRLSRTEYGCCPYTNGTCCANRVHCCPSGFKCDLLGIGCILTSADGRTMHQPAKLTHRLLPKHGEAKRIHHQPKQFKFGSSKPSRVL